MLRLERGALVSAVGVATVLVLTLRNTSVLFATGFAAMIGERPQRTHASPVPSSWRPERW